MDQSGLPKASARGELQPDYPNSILDFNEQAIAHRVHTRNGIRSLEHDGSVGGVCHSADKQHVSIFNNDADGGV